MRQRTWPVVSLAFAATLLIAARGRSVHPAGPPTFNREIIRIFQANCQSCHHPGDIAPFSLMTYDETKVWADNIRFMTETRQMPPWKPSAEGVPLKAARILSAADIATIAKWVDAGAPEGDARDLPQSLHFNSDWSEGTPDLVLQSPESFTVAPGNDVYRCFSIPISLNADAAVAAIDTRPGDRSLVHHVIAFIDESGASEQLDANDPGPGYGCFGGPGFPPADALGGWAPGARPSFLPDGIATRLPKSSRVVLQVHYHPHDGKGGTDRTALGVYFSKAPVQHWLHYVPIMNDTFLLAPGQSGQRVEASETVPWFASATLWSITPHMHLLGKTMRVVATYPDGHQTVLVDINDWDFRWQGTYAFASPVPVPGGTKISLVATYDNSSANIRNPNNPPKAVAWGEQTTDEMCVAFLGATTDIVGFDERASTSPWVSRYDPPSQHPRSR